MGNFLGAILFTFGNSNKIHIICFAAIVLTMLVLAVLHHRWKHYEREMKLWKKL